jgi:hypothetical protein
MTSALRGFMTATLVLAGSVAVAAPAVAEDLPSYPAGQACTFALGIEASGAVDGMVETSLPPTGKILTAGRGRTLKFTNLDTGASATVSTDQAPSVTVKASGSVLRTTQYPDGSSIVSTGGHNVIILFPTDYPAGPSTKLYVGSLVYRTDQDENFTVLKFGGRTTDICALLS